MPGLIRKPEQEKIQVNASQGGEGKTKAFLVRNLIFQQPDEPAKHVNDALRGAKRRTKDAEEAEESGGRVPF